MQLRSQLCDVLGIDFPILSVGFGWSTTAELVGEAEAAQS